MDLLYKKEHTNCPNYDSGPKPAIQVHELSAKEYVERNALLGKIIFLLEGELVCSFATYNNYTLESRQMLFLPPGYSFTLRAEATARFLLVRLPGKIQFCECYLLESLTRQTIGMEMEKEESEGSAPFLLEMNQAMNTYTDSLVLFMGKGLCCKYYFETRIKELFYLLRAFYPKEELAHFFWNALSTDSSFSHFAANNYHKYKTLSQMAEAMNMTLSGFEKRFKRVFSISAARWINEQKSKKIYHAICNEQASFKELSQRFGFSSKSTFNDFCKRNLGETPGKIRKKIQLGGIEEHTGGNQ